MSLDADGVTVIFNLSIQKRNQLHDAGSSCCFLIDPERHFLRHIHIAHIERRAGKQLLQNFLCRAGLLVGHNLVHIIIKNIGNVLAVKLGVAHARGDGLLHLGDIENQSLNLQTVKYSNRTFRLAGQKLDGNGAFAGKLLNDTAAIDHAVALLQTPGRAILILFIEVQCRVRRYLPIHRTDGLVLRDMGKGTVPADEDEACVFQRRWRDRIVAIPDALGGPDIGSILIQEPDCQIDVRIERMNRKV